MTSLKQVFEVHGDIQRGARYQNTAPPPPPNTQLRRDLRLQHLSGSERLMDRGSLSKDQAGSYSQEQHPILKLDLGSAMLDCQGEHGPWRATAWEVIF